jgi:hypothetical protein
MALMFTCLIHEDQNVWYTAKEASNTSWLNRLYFIVSWQPHIQAKSRQLELKVRNVNWLINRKSQLSLENKITIYKAIKLVWTYGIELWGCSKPSNTKILQTFQSKTLRKLADAPWYILNITLHNDECLIHCKRSFQHQLIEQTVFHFIMADTYKS